MKRDDMSQLPELAAVAALQDCATSAGWRQAQQTYRAGYEAWGSSNKLSPEQLETPTILALWLYSEHPTWSWKTASHAVSAIGTSFKQAGRPNPAAGEEVRRLLASYRRLRRTAAPPTRPFAPRYLTLSPGQPSCDDLTAAVLAAALSVAWVAKKPMTYLGSIPVAAVTPGRSELQLDGLSIRAEHSPVHAVAVRAVGTLAHLAVDPSQPVCWPLVNPAGGIAARVADIAPQLENLLRAAATQAGMSWRSQSLPGSLEWLDETSIRRWITDGAPQPLRRARDRAMLLCGLGHRAIDISRIDLSTICLASERHTGLLPRSKSDLWGYGRALTWDHTGSAHCPHCALDDWVAALTRRAPAWEGALFPRLDDDSLSTVRLTDFDVTKALRAHCLAVGLNPDEYSSRSLRVGAATAMAEAGADLDEITDLTGHVTAESAAMYMRFDSITPARLPY